MELLSRKEGNFHICCFSTWEQNELSHAPVDEVELGFGGGLEQQN